MSKQAGTQPFMRRMAHRTALVAGAIIVITGCSGLVSRPAPYVTYDLGIAAADGEAPRLAPASLDVRAPSWLASSAMQYRLDYRQPASRDSYAESRWAGHPSEMLRHVLNGELQVGLASAYGCRLRLELEEFTQVFESEERAHALVAVQARLIAPREELTLATHRFAIRTPANAPDARGGVDAHRSGVRVLAEALRNWLDALDADDVHGLNVGNRCRT